ncbi:MAG: hypothetical protein HZB42_07090 [Sphingobacteriales bacterium]|nr:hypothetical protein [Sphingobacteriales bacterium]
MKEPLSAKQIWICIAYTILLIPFAILINLALKWCFNNILFDVLNWLNRLSIVMKVFVLIAAASIVIWFVTLSLSVAFSLLIGLIFRKLPINGFIVVVSVLTFIVNVFLGIRELWGIVLHWNLWTVIEFFMLCLLVLGANYSLVAILNKKKEDGQLT